MIEQCSRHLRSSITDDVREATVQTITCFRWTQGLCSTWKVTHHEQAECHEAGSACEGARLRLVFAEREKAYQGSDRVTERLVLEHGVRFEQTHAKFDVSAVQCGAQGFISDLSRSRR